MLRCAALCYMGQFLFPDFESCRVAWLINPAGQFQDVTQKRRGGLGLLPQIIHRFRGDDHLHCEPHGVRIDVTDAMKDGPNIGSASVVANRDRGLSERFGSEVAQKTNRIEEIGFSNAVRARNAGKGAETHVYPYKVLKAVNLKAGYHFQLEEIGWNTG